MTHPRNIFLAVLAFFATIGVAAAFDSWISRERSTGLSVIFGAGPTIERYHDNEKGVTCWVLRHSEGPALSCIPDRNLTNPANQSIER